MIRRSIFIDEHSVGRKPRFNLGVTVLRSGVTTSIFSDDRESPREKFCMVIRGEMKVVHEGDENRLKQFDCLYATPGSSYLICEADGREVIYFWIVAPPVSQEVEGDDKYSGTAPRIIMASEVSPSVIFTEAPDRRTSFEMLHGENFNIGLVKRPSGAYGQLHTHDPPDCEEAYVSIQGTVEITDTTRVSHILEPYDSLYVPPFGGNSNRNIGQDECVYAYVESPAIAVKEIPVKQS